MNTISNKTNITIKIDKDLKKRVDSLFKKLGTTTNSAINMFLRECDREQKIVLTPSIVPVPNKELLESLQEIENYKNGKIELDSYDDVKSLRKALTDE